MPVPLIVAAVLTAKILIDRKSKRKADRRAEIAEQELDLVRREALLARREAILNAIQKEATQDDGIDGSDSSGA